MKTFKEFLLAEVDSRSQYDKAKALYDHPSTHPNIRAAAKSAMNRLQPSAPSKKRAFPGPGADWSRKEKHDYHKNAAEMHNNGYNSILNVVRVPKDPELRKIHQGHLDYHWDEMQHHRREAEKYA